MDNLKSWESPQIEELNITDTAFETRLGTNADGYEYFCEKLYDEYS